MKPLKNYKWGWYAKSRKLHMYSLNLRGTDALMLCDPLRPIPLSYMGQVERGRTLCANCLRIAEKRRAA